MQKTVAVIGGGVAGLAVSHELLRQADSIRLVCLEESGRPGGNIRTGREEGYICEWGPNGFLDNAPATLELAERVGLRDRLLPADAQSAIRYIWRNGRLHRIPGDLFRFTGLLSLRGLLRILGEPFARRRPEDAEESVYRFAARRIGAEAAGVLVGSMVTGIYAGDVRQLCLRSTFPKMHAMETEHGSLFKAMLARRGGGGGPAGPGGHLTSFTGGLDELTDALAGSLGEALRLNSPVEGLQRRENGGFRLKLGTGESLDSDVVILACPSWKASGIVHELDPDLAGTLREIPSAPLAVVHTGYDESDFTEKPVGFGYLVPRNEGVRILGTLWSSNIFPNRAPAGKFLATTMIGGALDPEVLQFDDGELAAMVRADLRKVMGVEAEPAFVRVYRHSRGIPQYTLGHQGRLAAIDRRLEAHPGLLVHGNSYRGISVNLCVEQAPEAARRALAFLD